MDASFTTFRSRRDFDEDDDLAGGPGQYYRAPTLGALTERADALQRPSGSLTFGLKNVEGAVASSNAVLENSSGNSLHGFNGACDASRSRLTFRANLTTLTEAERRKIASHKTGEDKFEKMASKDDVPPWLRDILQTPLKETQEFLSESRHAHSPTQPYTPPHLDPISPAVVSREYWKVHPRRDLNKDKRHYKHSSSRQEGRRSKRERSPDDRHRSRHHRSEKRHRHSSDHHGRSRRRRPYSYSSEDERDERRSSRSRNYVDPGVAHESMAIRGASAKISPPKSRKRQRSTPIDVADWVRSTSQPAEPRPPFGALREVFPIQDPVRSMMHGPAPLQHPTYAPVSHQNLNKDVLTVTSSFLPFRQNMQRREVSASEAMTPSRSTQHRSFTPGNLQPITPIFQPVPTRPIQINRLEQTSHATPLHKQYVLQGAFKRPSNTAFQGGLSLAGPRSMVEIQPLPLAVNTAFKYPAARGPHALSPASVVRPILPMPAASTHTPRNQAFRPITNTVRPPSIALFQHMGYMENASDITLSDSGYGNMPTHILDPTVTVHQRQETGANAIKAENPFNPNEAFSNYGGREPIQRTQVKQELPEGSVWNPHLANCTATRPRRLTLKQENDFEEAHRRHHREDLINSISVVKDSQQSQNKHISVKQEL